MIGWHAGDFLRERRRMQASRVHDQPAAQMLQLLADGTGRVVELGPEIPSGQTPQVVVPAGVWQGSLLKPGGDFALLGTTMAPGFDFRDYEARDREMLLAQYPAFAEFIQQLTRG